MFRQDCSQRFTSRRFARRLVMLLLVAPWLWPGRAAAEDEALPNSVWVQAGGQIKIAQYQSFMKLGAGYARWLSGKSWLDLGSTVLVLRETDWAVNGGIRWKFDRTPSGVRAFIRTGLEVAVLLRDVATRYVIGVRAGGGAGYYSSPGFGATVEASLSLGPAFGDGIHVASSLDILLGMEFPF